MAVEKKKHPKTSKNILVGHYTEELKKVAAEQVKNGRHKQKSFFQKSYISHVPVPKTDRTGEGTASFVFHFAPGASGEDELVLDAFTLYLPPGKKATGTSHDPKLHLYFEEGLMSAVSLFHSMHLSPVAFSFFQPHLAQYELDHFFRYAEEFLHQLAPNFPYFWITLDTNEPQILFTSSNANLENPARDRRFAHVLRHRYLFDKEKEAFFSPEADDVFFTIEDYTHALQAMLGIIPVKDLENVAELA